MDEAFTQEMTAGYGFDEPCVILGRPTKDGEIETGSTVQVPLSMMNRHGLVAGATGTGKTKTAAEAATTAPPLPPPPPAPGGGTRPEGRTGAQAKRKARPRSRARDRRTSEKSMGDQAKDIGIGLAKDLFTTADGRRTLRTVFGTLLGRK